MSDSSMRKRFRRLLSNLRAGYFDRIREQAHSTLVDRLTDDVLRPLQELVKMAVPRSLRERPVGRIECLLRVGGTSVRFTARFTESIIGLAAVPFFRLARGRRFTEQRLHDPDTQQLLGLLCLPRRRYRIMPVVVLLPGSGPQNADYTIGSSHIFSELAWGLAGRGIGSVRFDKRMPANAVTSGTVHEEYVLPVMAILRVLALNVPDSPVFLLGHSLGGYVAPLIAWRQTQIGAPLAGVFAMAAPWRTLEDLIAAQANELMPLLNDSEVQDLQQDLEHLRAVASAAPGSDRLAFGMSSTYLQNLREHHPVDWLNIDTQTPLLLLQGLADEQISPRLDFEQWVSATGHRSACQWRAYEGLDHLFKRSQSGRPVQDYVRRRTIAAAVIRDLARWLHAPQVALTAKPANRGWSIDGKAPRPTPCCSIARQACPAPVRPR
ncbi:S9 family peptidase [Pseudomonas sp. p106]|uniref:alpha/beta hydrolase family protein n=1 Tax=Pseudomonas sp. p106 TaxID=2479854 RepID=UPI0013154140|nr:alpha/beta hydrolase [Pseudomonas sp. p106]